MLPNGWETSDLRSVIEIKHGFAFKSEFYSNSGRHILLTPGHFKESGGFRDIGEKTKFYIGEIPSGYELKKDDLLLAMTEQAPGLLGSSILIPENKKYLHNQRLGLVTVINRKKADKKFLFWLYNAPYIRKQVSNEAAGTKVRHTSPDKLRGVTALLPPISEQIKIAQILSTWDQAIETTEKLIENSKAQKKALMQHLLTGKKRLPEFSGEWKATPISKFIIEDRSPGSTGYTAKKLTVKLYGKGVVIKNENRKGSESTKYFRRKGGQFIYSKLDFLNGAFGIIPAELDGYESTLDLPAFDFTNDANPNWFLFFVSRKSFYSANLGLANGGRKARRVNPKDMLGVRIHAPDYAEQTAIASVLSTASMQVENYEHQLLNLQRQKKGLMQQLLTGKRRVKVENEQPE